MRIQNEVADMKQKAARMCILVCIAVTCPLSAGVPAVISYQGRYFENNEPYTGTKDNCWFRVTDATYNGTTGTVYFATGPLTLAFANGLFNTSVNCSTVAWSTAANTYYLAVHIGGRYIGKELIHAVPYAFFASSAGYAADLGRAVNTTAPLSGGGPLDADRTLSVGGLSSLGAANQVVGANAAASGWEYKGVTGTASEVDITHSAGQIQIGIVDPLVVSKGGTGASTLTGVVKGNGTGAFTAMTGTQNYTARWTDATTLGAGVLYDDGSNVGVSTASPAATLHVGKPAGTTGSLLLVTTGTVKVFEVTAGSVTTKVPLYLPDGSVLVSTAGLGGSGGGGAFKVNVPLPVHSAKLPSSTFTARIDASENNWRLLFSTGQVALWQGVMDARYDGTTLYCDIYYTMDSATSGNIVWNVEVMAVTPGDSVDINTKSYASVNATTDSVPGTAGYLKRATVTLTNADSIEAGDFYRIRISRNAIGNTATGVAEMVGAVIRQ